MSSKSDCPGTKASLERQICYLDKIITLSDFLGEKKSLRTQNSEIVLKALKPYYRASVSTYYFLLFRQIVHCFIETSGINTE